VNIAKLRVPGSPAARPARPVDIDPKTFPDAPTRGDTVACTIDNVRHMLDSNGVTVRYNVVRKRTEIAVPWLVGTAENADAVSMTHIQSLASRYNMPTGLVPAMVEALGDENSYNPAADWMHGRAWDGTDRLQAMCRTIVPREGYPPALRDLLLRKWLLSVAAAATMPDGFKCRGVLTLQGRQGMGKTSWGLALVDDPHLRPKLIKVDHHLDPSNKDSILGAIDHLIVEIGELDSSFRRDMARLKGWLTSGTDKVRRPYGRVTAEYQRRTVFYATVNAPDFLVDDTGNSRWWTIPVETLDYEHGIDMQQVFAQCVALLRQGEIWWLLPEEERMLERQNSRHRSVSIVRDRLAAIVDPEVTDTSGCGAYTASDILIAAGFPNPSNAQAKEAAGYLREWFGESRRINGRDKWRVPLRPGQNVETDDDQPVAKVTPKTLSKSKFD
jgi:predicted P-loop ATPase